MKNRDMPAAAIFSSEGFPIYSGLTKLEEAAIRIHAARFAGGDIPTPETSVYHAKALFDELEIKK